MRASKCNCDDHGANATQGGRPIALWACPIHGNVCDDAQRAPVLTSIQRSVLDAFKKSGRRASVDDLSRELDISTGATRVALSALVSAGLIGETT
jgi:hypothetical protein